MKSNIQLFSFLTIKIFDSTIYYFKYGFIKIWIHIINNFWNIITVDTSKSVLRESFVATSTAATFSSVNLLINNYYLFILKA